MMIAFRRFIVCRRRKPHNVNLSILKLSNGASNGRTFGESLGANIEDNVHTFDATLWSHNEAVSVLLYRSPERPLQEMGR